jgi:hypothetical protein
MGSSLVGAWIGQIVFWVLIVWGVLTESLGARASIVFASLWLAPFVGVHFHPAAAPFFSPYVAVLDIVLVFILFKGDVRLT